MTTLWRAIRANKEDRVAKLEWSPNGGLGRAIIGKVGTRGLGLDQITCDRSGLIVITPAPSPHRARCPWLTSSGRTLAST